MESRPLCFVLIPFGVEKDPAGGPDIDFDAILEQGLRPGIDAAGMEPVRADEERTGGIIHRAMYERLLLRDFAVADLTTANADVLHELGVRHAARPATTLPIFASKQPLPFDVTFARAMPYDLSDGNRFGPEAAASLRSAVTRRLGELRELVEDYASDSPLFKLLTDWPVPDLARLETDVFRERVHSSTAWEPESTANDLSLIADAREDRGVDTSWLRQVIDELGERVRTTPQQPVPPPVHSSAHWHTDAQGSSLVATRSWRPASSPERP